MKDIFRSISTEIHPSISSSHEDKLSHSLILFCLRHLIQALVENISILLPNSTYWVGHAAAAADMLYDKEIG
jgi:hypothetical protein